MSGYGSMQASPFWKRVMAVTGILCLITLITPALYFAKYLVFDRAAEAAEAGMPAHRVDCIPYGKTPAAPCPVISPPLEFQYVEMQRNLAAKGGDPAVRSGAADWLAQLVRMPNALITHPVECMLAKTTISSVAATDPDQSVRAAAAQSLERVMQNGVVIER